VLDLCLQDGHLLIITCDQESCRNWKLRRWVEGEWSTEDSISTQGDDLVGLSCAGDRVGTLTSKRLIETENGAQTSVTLSDEISPKLVITTLDTPSQLIVGVNQGEFGGGLWRIDRGTGQIAAIEGKATGKFCRDSLDSNCDPINGIAIEPWNPACMLIAVGVVHFGPLGRIAEVCGDSVRTFFSKPYEEDPAGSSKRESADGVGHVAFFSMVRKDGELWTAGIDGIYRIDGHGTAWSAPLPKFKRVGDVDVSFDLPHFVVVWTSIYSHQAVSPPEPMIVSR
jgi:hypothetical protein